MNLITVLQGMLVILTIVLATAPGAYAHDFALTHTEISLSDESVIIEYTTPTDVEPSFKVANDGPCKLQTITRNQTDKLTHHKLNYSCGPLRTVDITETTQTSDERYQNIVIMKMDGKSAQYVLTANARNLTIAADQLRAKWRNTTNGTATNDDVIATCPAQSEEIVEGTPFWTTAWQFFLLGIEHILDGYDHILFLIGLLVIVVSVRELLVIVTSFTVAHSITLILASVGVIALPSRITESVIAASIVFIAVENIAYLMRLQEGKRPKGWFANPAHRWMLVFGFGLVHGLGFSSALREIGLPDTNLIPALLSFNIGVEAGQLMIVAVTLPVMVYLHHKGWRSRIAATMSIIIGIAGAAWLVQRVLL